MPLASGSQLGSYQILSSLGAGGMGEVYRARDAKLERDVAVKVLPAAFAEDPERLHRFRQEVLTLAKVSHPNIVQIFDAGEHEGSPFLVMELLEGETLRKRLEKGPLPWRTAVELGVAMADGLVAAHAKGIVHRDLKPENVIVDENGHLKLLDFGLAKQRPVNFGAATTLDASAARTLEGTLVGTVGYMSPEQIQGLTVDARSDLFSFGAVLYEMVTGQRAFQGHSAVEVLSAILKDPVPEASLSGSGGTPELDRILSHCLEKAPNARFQTARDLAFDLRALLGPASGGVAGLRAAKPGFRPLTWLLACAAVLSATAGLALWRPWIPKAPPYEEWSVAFLPFENRTAEASLDALGREALDLVRKDLLQCGRIKVVDPALPQGAGDPARRLAEAARAHYVASASCSRGEAGLRFEARLLDPWKGKVVLQVGPWQGQGKDAAGLKENLHQYLAGAIAWSADEQNDWEPGTWHTPRMDAYLLYHKALSTFLSDRDTAVAMTEKVARMDQDWITPRYFLVDSYADNEEPDKVEFWLKDMEARFETATPVEQSWIRLCRNYTQQRWLGVVKAIEDIRAIHPDTPNLAFKTAESASHAGYYGTTERELSHWPREAFNRWGETEWFRDGWLGYAYHLSGDFRRELRVSREAEKVFPDVLNLRYLEASALVGLGRLVEVGKVLDAASGVSPRPKGASMRLSSVRFEVILELHVHGHAEESRRLAAPLLAEYEAEPPGQLKANRYQRLRLLLVLGRDREALAMAQEMAEEQTLPRGKAHCLGIQACVLARMGRSAEARALDGQIAALEDPHLFGAALYHRGALAAQLGERDRAVDLLRQGFGQGFEYDGEGHLDLFLEPLHGYPPYEELVKSKD